MDIDEAVVQPDARTGCSLTRNRAVYLPPRYAVMSPGASSAGLSPMKTLLIAAVMLVAGAPAVAAQANPKTFVTALYKSYDGPHADTLGAGADKIFSPSLLALLRADKGPNGETGKIDYDPICGCQDADGLKLLSVEVKATSAAVHAVSMFQIGAAARVVNLTLIKTPDGWRVDDVNPDSTGSLRAYLGNGKHNG